MTQAVPGQAVPEASTYVYDVETGAPRQIGTADVPDAIRSGRYGFAPGQRVDILNAEGRPEQVDAQQAAAIFAPTSSAGLHAQAITPGQAQDIRDAEQYGSFGQQLRTGAEGAADAATFGLFGKTLEHLDRAGEYRERAKQNPWARSGGEVGGIAATALLTGGASAARGAGFFGRAAQGAEAVAGALPRGVAAAGEAGAGIFGRGAVALGAAEGGAIARGAALVGRSAVEGSIYGVGNTVSESALKGDPLTVDKIVAGALHGGALGAGMGLGLSLGAAALGRIASKGGDILGDLTKTSKITDLAGEIADTHAIKALGASKGEIMKLQAKGNLSRAAARVRDELPEVAGKKLSQMDRGELSETLVKALDVANAERAALLDEADKLVLAKGNEALRPNIGNIATETRKLIAEQYYRGVNEHIGARLEADVAKLEKQFAGAGFRDLQKERTALDKQIKHFGANVSPEQHAYIAYRNIIEDEIKRAGDVVATKGGSSAWGARYQAAKDRVADYLTLKPMVERGAAGDVANRTAGLSEHLSGMGVGGALGTAGHAIGGPVGGIVGNAVGGLLGGAVANYVKKYGSQHVAEIAGKAANSDVLRAIVTHVDNILGAGVAKTMGATAKRAPSLLAPMVATVGREATATDDRSPRDRYHARKAEIIANVSHSGRVDAWAKQMSPTDDDLRQKLLQKAIGREQFLASKLPVMAPKPTLDPHAPERDPAPAQMDKFLRYQRAADDPMTVFADIEGGRLSRESVEAVKAVYPALYQELRTKVTTHIMGQSKPPTYQEQIQLAVLLDIPARAMFEPKNIASYQAIISQPAPKAQPPANDMGPRKPIHIDNSTAVSRIEQGEST